MISTAPSVIKVMINNNIIKCFILTLLKTDTSLYMRIMMIFTPVTIIAQTMY